MAVMWAALVIAHLLMLPLLQASVEFDLYGNVYPDGHFYVAMSIGEPAKTYFLMIDTGSPVTWLECDFPLESPRRGPNNMYIPGPSNMVTCEDERCVALHKDLGVMHDCHNPDRCDYKIRYVDESSKGVLVADKFSFPRNNEASPNLAFGCGYKQEGGPDRALPVDGVLGLSKGTGDFVSQLKQQEIITENVVGHCIGINGGGFFFFGGDSNRVPTSGVTWLPGSVGTYSPGAATLDINVVQEFPVSLEPMRTIFDSGSTYSYVHSTTYARLLKAVGITLQGSSLTEVYDPELPQSQCWKDTEPISSVDDVKNLFRQIDMIFGHGDSQVQVTLEIPPENYITVTTNGNVCLGILSEDRMGKMNLIGANAMRNHIVIYDNERARIGWVRASHRVTSLIGKKAVRELRAAGAIPSSKVPSGVDD